MDRSTVRGRAQTTSCTMSRAAKATGCWAAAVQTLSSSSGLSQIQRMPASSFISRCVTLCSARSILYVGNKTMRHTTHHMPHLRRVWDQHVQ